MTEFILGNVLKEMYEAALPGEQSLNIHLFGIHYAGILSNFGKKRILEIAGLPDSYQAEINKGIKLAQYVDLNDVQLQRILVIQRKYES